MWVIARQNCCWHQQPLPALRILAKGTNTLAESSLQWRAMLWRKSLWRVLDRTQYKQSPQYWQLRASSHYILSASIQEHTGWCLLKHYCQWGQECSFCHQLIRTPHYNVNLFRFLYKGGQRIVMSQYISSPHYC